LITVSTAGTPANLNSNVGPQTGTVTTRPSGNVRQLIFYPDSDNTGNTYLVRKVPGQTANASTPNFIVAVLAPGVPQSVPFGSLALSAAINIDDYAIDGDTNGNRTLVTAVVG
jgi:hypothetical protein